MCVFMCSRMHYPCLDEQNNGIALHAKKIMNDFTTHKDEMICFSHMIDETIVILPCVFSGCSSALWKFAKGGWQLSLQQTCVPLQIPKQLKGSKKLMCKVCPENCTFSFLDSLSKLPYEKLLCNFFVAFSIFVVFVLFFFLEAPVSLFVMLKGLYNSCELLFCD